MRLMALIAAIAAAASFTHAQAQHAHTWPKEPESVFGLTFGQHVSDEDLPFCTASMDAPRTKITFCRSDRDLSSEVSVVGFGITELRDGMLFLDDAGFAKALIINGRQQDFPHIKDLLIERYGRPALTRTMQVKTRSGGSFTSQRLQWVGRRIVLTLDERSSRMDQSRIQFQYLPALVRSEQNRANRTKADAAKM